MVLDFFLRGFLSSEVVSKEINLFCTKHRILQLSFSEIPSMKNSLSWVIFIEEALLETRDDALIRKGLRSSGILLVIIGFIVLGSYGLVVNIVRWDFSKLLGVYVAVFAALSILYGRLVFKENIPASTWIGLIIIILGGLIIQYGQK
jgi:drug/metabolite transporter superfamily protein YnfA